VVELFEARKAARTAVISEIDGVVRFGEVSKGQRKLYVAADNGTEKEYSVPRGVHINVQEGETCTSQGFWEITRLIEMFTPWTRHDFLAVLRRKSCSLWSPKSRKSSGFTGVIR